MAEEQRAAVAEAGEQTWVRGHNGVMGDFDLGPHWTLRNRRRKIRRLLEAEVLDPYIWHALRFRSIKAAI
jgi:hypothetical protein